MSSPPITFILKTDTIASEIKDVFGSDFKFEIIHNTLQDYQGTEAHVLTEKCKDAVKEGVSYPIVTDINSVCFNALGGLPGTLISSIAKILKAEELYKLLEGWEDKSAYVMYSLGLLEDEKSQVQIFQGCMSGTVVEPKKPNATGWEACFQPDGFSKTYSQLPLNAQMDVSECKKALRSLKTYLISKEFFSWIVSV